MMTNDSKDQGREAFEAWCETEYISADRSTITGIYSYPSARVAWRAWQASLATSASDLARDEASVKNGWQTGTPHVEPGKAQEFILAVRRKQSGNRVFVFSATYANQFDDDGCLYDRNGDQKIVANGWHLSGLDTSGEFNEVYEPISLSEGDQIVGWQPLPEWSNAIAASSATTVSDAVSVPADCDVRKILLRVVPGDGDGHEVYAKNVGEVEQLLSELGERLENFESQVATASVAQDGPYGYAPIHPNGNYFTRNKSTADYVGGMVPVYARAASSATAPLTSDSDAQDERAAFHMDKGELEEFRQTVADFDDNGETSTPYDVLMYWAEHDLLDCSHFTVTDKGRALLGQEVPGFVASASSATAPLTSDSDALKDAGESVTLTGAQLAEALDFIAPDRDSDQLETEATIQYGTGHSGKGLYCWITEYPEEGAILLDGTAAQSTNGEQS